MLQQTQVKTVEPYYQAFIRRFSEIRLLANANLQDVLKVWEGLGYYARARNLHKAAKIIIENHKGILPHDAKSLRGLPGIGEYISSAILSIAYEKPHAVVDGNVKRVLARLEKIDIPVNQSSSIRTFRESATRLLAENDPGRHNQAMMELGAMVCKPRNPECSVCPVSVFCQAFRSKAVDQFPTRTQTPKIPQYKIATGIIFKGKNVLITQRKLEGLLGGLWEFPGGKVKKGETAESACVREIKEETNLEVGMIEHLTRIRHAYSHFKIVMDVFCCKYQSGRIRLNGPIDFQWIRPDEIDNYPFPGANHKFIPLLRKYIGKAS